MKQGWKVLPGKIEQHIWVPQNEPHTVPSPAREELEGANFDIAPGPSGFFIPRRQ
jgi:hypothetical protein